MNFSDKFISILISLVWIATGTFAQSEISPAVQKKACNKAVHLHFPFNQPEINKSKEFKKIKLELLCPPVYEYGCSDNDGFTGFALEEIQNLNNGCEDNTGITGWSEYYSLGPAILAPGMEYNFSMSTGYSNQHVNIWIDFNDDLILSQEEIILNDYVILLPDILYDVPVVIPGNASAGQHAMRVMAVWFDAFSDPCGSYLYGEAEDYYVQIEAGVYGNLEGYITALNGGTPIPNATVQVGSVATGTSGSDGHYYIGQVLAGTWEVSCSSEGYNPSTSFVTIEEGLTSSLDFQLTAPQMLASPLSVSVLLEPNGSADENLNIDNPGNGPLNWSAEINFVNNNGSEELFDLQFDWPVGGTGGEAGIESDGNYIYTAQLNGNAFYKYDLNGSYIGSFTCGSAGSVRDLAYDGTYFYGAAANSTVYQMDFTNEVLVSQFTAPTDIRAIAYNADDNTFYGNNWDTDITKFDMSGGNLGSFPVGPIGSSYYGFAYDNFSNGSPYLWGYAQTGNTLNELVQIQLPSGIETGLSFDVGSIAATGGALAGGLAITNAIIPGYCTLLGVAQDADIWGLELCGSGSVWLTIDPLSGNLPAGQNQDLALHFNALDLIPGYYYAEIHFSTDPTITSPIVDVTLHVEGLIPPANLDATFDCTDVILTWEMPAGATPDSWNVYRNGSLLGSAAVMTFSDLQVYTGVEYAYYVKAVYNGVESQPTASETIILPLPDNLEPLNPLAVYQGDNTVEITWDIPEGCLDPEAYNVYRFNTFVGSSATLSFTDQDVPNGYFDYFIRALYYFGESENSAAASVLVNIDNKSIGYLQIFPNPVSDNVYIESPDNIHNIKIYNASGQLILDKKVLSKFYQLDISNYNDGVYYIRIETDSKILLKKITVK